jgi:hypothetical protein
VVTMMLEIFAIDCKPFLNKLGKPQTARQSARRRGQLYLSTNCSSRFIRARS